jgi:hypothetical protein
MFHVAFAFRGVFHDPLRELRLDALNLLLSVRYPRGGERILDGLWSEAWIKSGGLIGQTTTA